MSLIDYRKKLKLTTQETVMFELLLKEGPMTAKQVAKRIDCLPNAVYRTGRRLEAKHYMTIIRVQPKVFHAINLKVALELNRQDSENDYKMLLDNFLGQVAKDDKTGTQVEILAGREALYQRYMIEASSAKKEILIFAIGIAYSKEMEDIQRKAIERKVEIRHIIQKNDAANYYVINKWLRLGVKMRYYTTPIGFHLMIFDSEIVILSISNPSNTDERTSLVFKSTTASQTLREYFFNLWGYGQLVN